MFSRIRASVMTSKLAEVEDERFLSSKLDSNDSDDDSRLREESDCHYDDIVLEPSPAVFVPSTHQRVISCDDNWARTSRPPQRSVTEKISEKRQLLSTSPPGPNQILQHKKESPEFMATLTGDKDNVIKIQEKPGKLDSWFKGSSEPVNFGIPVKECEEQIVAPPSTPLRPLNKLQRKSTAFSTKSPQASVSRFSFFSTPSKASQSLPTGDELLDIDIQTALAPSISPESYDAATFKNLLSNAESILTRMQVAYKERALSLRDLQAEKEAQDEEIEESNTRADHLKMQLADMAEKFAEQEKTMTEMVEELAHERQLRKAEEEARKRSIALVKAPPNIAASSSRDGRDSGIGMASDSGFESRRRELFRKRLFQISGWSCITLRHHPIIPDQRLITRELPTFGLFSLISIVFPSHCPNHPAL